MNSISSMLSPSLNIMEKTRIGLWVIEMEDGKEPRMYVDDIMLGLIGLTEYISPEETYHAWYDHIDNDCYDLVSDAVEKMIAGEHAEVQYPWHSPDGRTLIVRCGGIRNTDYNAGIRLEGTHQNVTTLVHLDEEKKRHEQQELLLMIISALSDSYDTLYYIEADTGEYKMFTIDDYFKDNVSGRLQRTNNFYSDTKNSLAGIILDEDHIKVDMMTDPVKMAKAFENGNAFHVDYRVNVNGEPIRYRLKAVKLLGTDQKWFYALGVARIEEQLIKEQQIKESLAYASQQRQLKSFGDMVNAALWSIRINDNNEIVEVDWSDEFRHMLGFEKTTEDFPNTLEAWSSRLYPEDRERTLAHFRDCIESRNFEGFVYDIDYRVIRKTGEPCWYHAAGRMEDKGSGLRKMFGIFYDISTSKKLEEQRQRLAEALSMAESASRAKTTFLNNMSHDIRTPMNAIIGYTGLAASHIDNKLQVQDYLSKISQSSSHLLSLINDVLDMSRIESGKMNICASSENISEIIHTLRNIVQADIHSKQLDFYVDAVDVNDENILCDKLRLNQVLLNILSNAIKYTAAGGTVAMRVSEKTVRPNGYATYEFRIKDNGMGMTPEFLKTIYDPFTRGKSTTVSGIQGTGLGMAITKNIVDMMSGTIDITSEPGKGTEVTLLFDFKLENAPKQPTEIPEFKGMRALVVDDDSHTCISLARMIRAIGMRDEWCTAGREVVIRAEEAYQTGDLFRDYVLDWLMPDINGIETTRRIRRVIGDDVPIIILTAYDWSDIEDEAREAGVTAFISKPMFPSDLSRVLNSFLKKEHEPISTPKVSEIDFTGKKLLLVEDNEINREIAVEILEEKGFTIDTAEDGDIAVDVMKTAGPLAYNAILMDIQMPRMNGYEATKAIRKMYPDAKLPIIALSANAFVEDKAASLAAGMTDHIAKPINVTELVNALARLM